MNRGSQDTGPRLRMQPCASMRPRFMNRGSCGADRGSRDLRGRFNEAPIHESGKYSARVSRVRTPCSFNEAPIHESGKYAWQSPVGARSKIASMRPRFMNRGSSPDAVRAARDRCASMRPRFMNRGSWLIEGGFTPGFGKLQ